MEKTEAQIEKEKQAVAAMANAKSNMTAALDRIKTLETALRNASGTISTLKGYIAPNVYTYPVQGNSRRCTDHADAAIAEIAKVLA